MAVNLDKQTRNKVNLSKGDKASGERVKLTKTPAARADGLSGVSTTDGVSETYNDNYSPQMGTAASSKKFKPWFLIPVAVVLLIALVVALSHKNLESDDGYEVTDRFADSAISSVEVEEAADSINEDEETMEIAGIESESVDQEITLENENAKTEICSEANETLYDSEASVVDYVDDAALHSYDVITADVTWEEAFADCISRGGYLCRINSEKENNKIKEILNEKNVRGVVYLGGLRDENSEEYHWIDSDRNPFDEVLNSEENMKYWLDGEPSFSDTVDNEEIPERYMAMIYPGAIKNWVWNDVSNDVLSLAPNYYTGRLSYICEYE